MTVAGRAFPEGFCSLDKKASSAERPGAVMENGGSVDYDDHCTVVAVIDEPQKCSFFTSLFHKILIVFPCYLVAAQKLQCVRGNNNLGHYKFNVKNEPFGRSSITMSTVQCAS